ncbi:DNA ligase 4 [Lindgomyces ingoldianus]|uniref:DNA ligase 4 n=1 Tax=Lindgomyces ingoldianus TaxID=673940 RepID=A0ACB6R7C2_9PLEO|nr:DNA ligase 4 [Lindgomyces ingoldianus]KAF2475204.1 DNA ligase 4 [Lindgomyces ingoldianus]
MAEDIVMPDADAVREQKLQYRDDENNSEAALDKRYPNRPRNLHKTLPFHSLITELFNPLLDSTKKNRPSTARRKQGPQGQASLSPHEARRNIIEQYIAKWRKEVGNDFYPAMRLVIPEKDRDRAMYGLKEKAIAKILIKVMKINKDSEDAKNMINWKLPGQLGKFVSSTAGDFAGRCFEVLSKRPMRTAPGDMSIADVNNALDHLSRLGMEDEQLSVFKRFYRRMNPEEMTWLIRMILRQMKIGATEKTILDIWHPDAETLFNVSSNLRRVCWELYDPRIRLDGGDAGITLMECFQPQLAAFQKLVGSFEKMVAKLKPTPDDDSFWIEEKLDGERMQLHMIEDPDMPGGKRFGFWSRKAKDYHYLYGQGLEQENSALTRFLKDAFASSVRNIILDGEMITWDMDVDRIVGFGTLKTAALSEKENRASSSTGQRPLYRVFDCLYLNDTLLAPYMLRDRRNALASAVKGVRRRLEIHPYIEAHSYTEIEPELRKVVAEASEGLVLKNPRSMYRLNERNDDWIKVKPEYMSEFGESLDCVVVGGYFGSGHRGGAHSSFLCGLLVNKHAREGDPDYEKCYSFFKVGGGFSREDYAAIRGRTEGKWKTWDPKRPPSIIELGGHAENRQHERPDQWIRPSESVVLECKAASVESSDKFRMSITLRFPRFKQLRADKKWEQALSISEFMELKDTAEREHDEKEKEFKIEQSRRKKARTTKKPLVIAGNETVSTPYAGPASNLFSGLNFFIMTDALTPSKITKPEIEALVKAHGGKIVQRESQDKNLIIIADKRLVKVSSLEKRETNNIVKPIWIYDCIQQSSIDVNAPPFVLPFEPNRHMFFLLEDDQLPFEEHVDEYGDSYTRDVSDVSELRKIFDNMPQKFENAFEGADFVAQAGEHGQELMKLKNYMFSGMKVCFDDIDVESLGFKLTTNYIRFGGGMVVVGLEEGGITHVVVRDEASATRLRRKLFVTPLPRIVGVAWVERCWDEGTRVDEERFHYKALGKKMQDVNARCLLMTDNRPQVIEDGKSKLLKRHATIPEQIGDILFTGCSLEGEIVSALPMRYSSLRLGDFDVYIL